MCSFNREVNLPVCPMYLGYTGLSRSMTLLAIVSRTLESSRVVLRCEHSER